MEEIINILTRNAKTNEDETIRGAFINLASEEEEITQSNDYYYLTDLCDPVKKFLKTSYPEVKNKSSERVRKIMMRGNAIHRGAEIWIKNMDNFFNSESKLDGFMSGLNVVGKIDAKVDGKIIELKSKVKIPKSVQEVIEQYPQDIEQLAFYSILDLTLPNENYLVFISQDSSSEIKVFKMKTKNRELIKKVLKQRINLLEGAKKGKIDCVKLGKCRRCFQEDCEYKERGLCRWINSELPCGVSDFIELSEDENFTKKIEIARLKWDNSSNLFRPNEIITARKKFYDSKIDKIEEEWSEDFDKILSKGYISTIAFNFLKKYGEEKIDIPTKKIRQMQPYKKWINLKTSKDKKGKTKPYLTSASMTNNEWYLKHKPSYPIAQLAIICATYGVSSGYLFEYLPNLDVKFRIYEVSFENIVEVSKKINKTIEILNDDDKKRFDELLLCPDFICENKGKGCLIREFCEKKDKFNNQAKLEL